MMGGRRRRGDAVGGRNVPSNCSGSPRIRRATHPEIGNHQKIETFSNPTNRIILPRHLYHVFLVRLSPPARLGLAMPYLIIHSSPLYPLGHSPVSELSLSTCDQRAAIAVLPERQSGVVVPFPHFPDWSHWTTLPNIIRLPSTFHSESAPGQYGCSHRNRHDISHQLAFSTCLS